MKPREYRIIIHSTTRLIIAWLIIFLSSIFLIDEYTPPIENEIIFVIQFIAILTIAFYLSYQIGMARIKIQITEEGFIHIWERRYLFSFERNIIISWDKIDDYVFQEDRNFDSFIINLNINRRYKINRINLFPINDDFNKFLEEFPELSNEFKNKTVVDKFEKIKKGKTLFEYKGFKWVLYFLSFGFSLLLFNKISNPESSISWANIGVIGSGLLFYWTMTIKK